MISEAFIEAIREVRASCTGQQWRSLMEVVDRLCGQPGSTLKQLSPPESFGTDATWLLHRACRLCPDSSALEARAVMVAVDHFATQKSAVITPVWTGPENGTFPVRRYDQVLYDRISTAQERILIVTFAAYKVDRLVGLLSEAMRRGVKLSLILEGEESSGGQLTFDALNALRGISGGQAAIYSWPLEKRPRNPAGRPGKLHAKTAIVDDVVLIGSGNLTDDAFNRNMELGLSVEDQHLANAVFEHFIALITRGELRPIKLG